MGSAHDEWVERVLAVDLRSAGSAELLARAKAVRASIEQRLAALTPDTPGLAEIAGRIDQLGATLDAALQDADLLAADGDRARFKAAAARAGAAVDALQDASAGLHGLAANRGAPADPLLSARQRRDGLKRRYETALASIPPERLVASAKGEGEGKGKGKTLRGRLIGARDAAKGALAATAFAEPDDLPGFEAAHAAAAAALRAFEQAAELSAVDQPRVEAKQSQLGHREALSLLQRRFGDEVLATFQADHAAILAAFGPTRLDTDLAPLQAKVHAALNAAQAIDPGADAAFAAALLRATQEVDGYVAVATPVFAPWKTRLMTLTATRKACQDARVALDAAAAEAGQFEAQRLAFVSSLPASDEALKPLPTKDLESARDKAVTAAAAGPRIAAAGALATRLEPLLNAALSKADATPAQALQGAWNAALANASRQLAAGEEAAPTLQAMQAPIEDAQRLAGEVTALRLRAQDWQQRLGGLDLTYDEVAPSNHLKKLLEPLLSADIAEPGNLGEVLRDAEAQLQSFVVPIEGFKLREAALRKQVQSLPVGAGPVNAFNLQVAEFLRSIPQRRVKPEAANAALEKAEALIAPVPDLCAALLEWQQLWVAVAKKDERINPQPTFEAAGTALKKADAGAMRVLAQKTAATLPLVRARAGLLNLVAPHEATLAALRSARSAEVKAAVDTAEAQAGAAADSGDGATARSLMQAVLDGSAGLQAAEQALQGSLAALADAPAPLRAALEHAAEALRAQLRGGQYAAAGVAGAALSDFVAAVPAWRKAWAALVALLGKVGPTQGKPEPAQAAATQARDAALLGTAKQALEAAAGLRAQGKALLQAAGPAILGAHAEAADAPRFEKLFDDPDCKAATLELAEAFGTDGLAGLIKAVGAANLADPGPAVVAALKALKKDLGVDKIRALSEALGGPAKVGALCDDAGDAGLATGLHARFETKLPALKSLVKDGFGDDPRRLRTITGGGTSGAERAEKLSDGFTLRSGLSRMIGHLGSDAEAAAAMDSICATHFAGNWSKLKTPFYDTLNAATEPARMMKLAKNFKAAARPNPMPAPADLSGFSAVDMGHTIERHKPENFALAKAGNIKPNNTQFAAGTTPQAIAAIVEKALAELKKFRDGPDPGTVALFQADAAFVKYHVTVADPGLIFQIGYNSLTMAVEQAFPIRTTPGSTITLDAFNESQMIAMKGALGK